MEKSDKKNIIVFIILIIMIIFLIIYNIMTNKKNINIDRKVNYIFEKYTYDNVYSKGKNLFLNAIKLVKNDFLYEKNESNHDVLYAINNYNQYKRIMDYQLIINTLSINEYKKYLDEKRIINKDDNYYIGNYNNDYNKKYIGSIIDIRDYDEFYVYFDSLNYYCDNYDYIGILNEEPNCKYTTTNTSFTIIFEQKALRINDLKDIEEILK